MKTVRLTVSNFFLCSLIVLACAVHPIQTCHQESFPNSSTEAVYDAAENHNEDTDQNYALPAYETSLLPEINSLIDNSILVPTLVTSIFIPPRSLS